MRGRLAPTPSGHLHLGNALAFGAAALSARAAGASLILRIEDLDRGRARAAIEDAQRAELRWLGIAWDVEVPPQSRRRYDLTGLPTFRCTCNRKTRRAGLCRCREDHLAGRPKRGGAVRFLGPRRPITFVDRARGPQRFVPDEDPILMSARGEAAYPLAVVLDDRRDGVTEVVRGADLLEATAVQIALYEAIGARPPSYLHTPLLLGPDGKKLSKSHGSLEVRALRARGWRPADVWRRLLPLLGCGGAETLDEALAGFDPARILPGPFVVDEAGEIHSAPNALDAQRLPCTSGPA